MSAADLVPALISGAALLITAVLAYRGSTREAALNREHRLIDQLQEERDHWQARAHAAEDLLRDAGPAAD